MFLLVAIIILIVSFFVALFSLVREQKKQHKQQDTEALESIGAQPALSTHPEAKPSAKIAPDVKHKEEEEKKGDLPRVDEESVPYPWEENKGKDLSHLEELVRRETVRAQGGKLQDEEKSGEDVIPEPQMLKVKRDETISIEKPKGLSGTISIKDLVDK